MRNNDVPTVWQNAFESIEHSVSGADDFLIESRVGLVQPRGQPDSARNRVDLSDDVTVIGENEIWPDDSRKIVANLFALRKFHQLRWFSGIEIARDPFRLFSFDAQLIELIAGSLKNE